MPVNVILLKISDKLIYINAVWSYLIVFIVLSLNHFQSELNFTLTIDSRNVEVKSAGCDG